MHTLYVRLRMCKQTMGNTGSASGKVEGERKWFQSGCSGESWQESDKKVEECGGVGFWEVKSRRRASLSRCIHAKVVLEGDVIDEPRRE